MLPGCDTSMDFTFIVDSSSSVCHGQIYNEEGTCDNFIALKEFMQTMVKELGNENVQTALINFATNAEVSIRIFISFLKLCWEDFIHSKNKHFKQSIFFGLFNQ
jgi:hypothetical protein